MGRSNTKQLEQIPGVGERIALALHDIGIGNIEQLKGGSRSRHCSIACYNKANNERIKKRRETFTNPLIQCVICHTMFKGRKFDVKYCSDECRSVAYEDSQELRRNTVRQFNCLHCGLMLNKKGVSAGRAVLISFTQTLLTNLMLMVFILYGLVYLMFSRRLDALTMGLIAAVIVMLTFFLVACLLMVYNERVRRRLLVRMNEWADRLLERFGYTDRFGRRAHRFLLHIDEGLTFFASEPRAMAMPLFWIFLDWIFTITVLYAALYSVGSDVSYGQVVVAFSVGIVFAVISFVPGGVGVLEVALNGMLAGGGVPREQSVLAIMIFRISFYVIPVLLALFVARGAFSDMDESQAEELV